MEKKLKCKNSGECKENGNIPRLGTTQAGCFSVFEETFAFPEQCLGKADDKFFYAYNFYIPRARMYIFRKFLNRYKFDGKKFATATLIEFGTNMYILSIQILPEEQGKELLSLC